MTVRPFAIGVVSANLYRTPTDRVRVAIRTNHEGYALVDTVEVTGEPCRDDRTIRRLSELSETLDASAFVVSATVDVGPLQWIADRVRMRIVVLDDGR